MRGELPSAAAVKIIETEREARTFTFIGTLTSVLWSPAIGFIELFVKLFYRLPYFFLRNSSRLLKYDSA